MEWAEYLFFSFVSARAFFYRACMSTDCSDRKWDGLHDNLMDTVFDTPIDLAILKLWFLSTVSSVVLNSGCGNTVLWIAMNLCILTLCLVLKLSLWTFGTWFRISKHLRVLSHGAHLLERASKGWSHALVTSFVSTGLSRFTNMNQLLLYKIQKWLLFSRFHSLQRLGIFPCDGGLPPHVIFALVPVISSVREVLAPTKKIQRESSILGLSTINSQNHNSPTGVGY